MRAIVIHHYGPPEVLRYEEVADPQPRAGEIRIRVHAATVNRVLDVSLRAGKETARGAVLPLIPGVDCAGVVDALGSDIKRWRRGMRVAAAGVMPLDACAEDGEGYLGSRGMMGIKRAGGFAELVAVPACAAVELPPGLGFHQAAVLMRHAPTAWNLLVNVAALKPGETVLIMGAGGNLGSLGIQIAKNIIGAKVIAAAGSATRVQMGLALGADHGINYNTCDLAAELNKLTGGKGVDVLYDNIANPEVLPTAFRSLGLDGRLFTAGAHAGPNVSIDFAHLYHNRIHQGTAGLPCAGRGKMLRRRRRGKDQATHCSRSAVVTGVRSPSDMEAGEEQGKIVLDPTLG